MHLYMSDVCIFICCVRLCAYLNSTNRSRLDWTDQMIETRKNYIMYILNTNLLIIIRNLIISFCSCVFTFLQFFLFFFGLFKFFWIFSVRIRAVYERSFVRSKIHHFMILIFFLEVRFVCIFRMHQNCTRKWTHRMHQIWFDTALSWEQFWCIR